MPNFVIRKFRVPIFLLPIYQAAGIQYGIRWEILAAINEIETDYGRNLNVSSRRRARLDAVHPLDWRAYGVDANKDGKKDPYNPVDAIFAAARYLKAAGYEQDVRRAIFAYNHADWYVDSVMLRARLIAGVPADLVGSLTGLTEGRFPVAARARYADDLAEQRGAAPGQARRERRQRGRVRGQPARDRDLRPQGAPVVAVNDGVIKKIGRSREARPLRRAPGRLRQPLHLRAPRLGVRSTTRCRTRTRPTRSRSAQALSANDSAPAPTGPASAGRQVEPDAAKAGGPRARAPAAVGARQGAPVRPSRTSPSRARGRRARAACSTRRPAARAASTTFNNYFSRPFGLDAKDVRLRR